MCSGLYLLEKNVNEQVFCSWLCKAIQQQQQQQNFIANKSFCFRIFSASEKSSISKFQNDQLIKY